MPFVFTPSAAAKKLFNLHHASYHGADWNKLIDDTLGRERAHLYVPPQDPLRGKKLEAGVTFDIEMTVNAQERRRDIEQGTPPEPLRTGSLGAITCI